ncbi:heme oxygenase (biliverdin-producing) [Paramicrobacterium agarici]|uniref:Heme oxygenase n=1 Tax=Paramicrobacterium agarici TaxID=630514 RepID=A0A2A9DWF1_9MICO|nr:biliverdin-producing heme oxygenase [Microbacterium agarici]PFG30239.1 heme oxygenase [Microbacterium agarici]
MTATRFSARLAERTRASHSDSEGAAFMRDLMQGRGTKSDYAALSAQHWFIYDALEAGATGLAADAEAAPFLHPELTRLPALERDLEHLFGSQWRRAITPLPTTEAYAQRIREVSGWPAGFIAHHYTRYLGDLSGGQFIARLMSRHFGFERRGVEFYAFDDIDDLDAFKNTYRRALDDAPWNDVERERMIDETLIAYRFNSDLFVDLLRQKQAAA